MSIVMWPNSAAAPCAPRPSAPLTTMPPPIPVPIVSKRASVQSSAAPNRHSASIAAVASLSTNTGRPSRSAIRSRNGTSRIGRCTVVTATPRS